MQSTGNETTDKLIGIEITGNMVHQNWYKTILMDNGKPDAISMLILADIVYWYKPTEIRDEITGLTIGFKTKFKSDLLQRSHEDISLLMGFTERQVTDAIKRLEKKGIINRVFRTVKFGNLTCYNVMYIQLNFDALMGITFNDSPSHVITCHPPQLNGIPSTVDGDTNTEITPSTSPEISQEIKTTTEVVTPAEIVVVPFLRITEAVEERKRQRDAEIADNHIAYSPLHLIPEFRLPGNVTTALLVELADKWSSVHGADIVQRQMVNLKYALERDASINAGGWLRRACERNWPVAKNTNLYNGDSPELVDAKNKFKQNAEKFKFVPVEKNNDDIPVSENYGFFASGANRALGLVVD